MNGLSGLAFYRTRNSREQRVPEYPLVRTRRRPLQGTSSVSTSSSTHQQQPVPSSADFLPLSLFRYGRGGQFGAMNAAIALGAAGVGGISLDPRSANSTTALTSSSTRSPYRSSQLCRCGSGGALPGQSIIPPLLPPPLDSGSPPALFAPSSFRTVQSLPSTPNTNRRPISPPINTAAANTTAATVAASNRPSDHRPSQPPSGPPFIGADPSRPEYFLFDPAGTEATALAPDLETGRAIGGHTSTRFRSSSQPLAKLSSFIIVLLAIIIIGFIVLSPVFHYAM